MIKLNIQYDPDLPDGLQWSGQYACAPKEPRFFKYGGRSVHILGLNFEYRAVLMQGFDPYSGNQWTLALGSPHERLGHFVFNMSDVVSAAVTIQWIKYADDPRKLRLPAGFKNFSWYGRDKMPLPWRWLWNFLERRRDWWEWCSEGAEDYPRAWWS
jgi:hypothetical protein